MSKPYDATLRQLFALRPEAWLEFLGFPVPDPSLVRVIDSNLSTISAEADKAVWVGGPEPVIVHTEVLAGRDLTQPARAHLYNTLLYSQHKVPVWTVMLLLRLAADGPELTGMYGRTFPRLGQNLWFRYDVHRVWLEPPEKFLTAGFPMLPLAPVSNVAPDQLAAVVTAVAERLKTEADPELLKTLWTSTAILMGLRYPREQVKELLEGVAKMVLGIHGIEDSWLYQDIFAEGKAEGLAEGAAKEARATLLRLGRKTLGEADTETVAEIAGLKDVERLNSLIDHIDEVSNWRELLASIE
jgi:hypothetical protein